MLEIYSFTEIFLYEYIYLTCSLIYIVFRNTTIDFHNWLISYKMTPIYYYVSYNNDYNNDDKWLYLAIELTFLVQK